MLLNFFQKVEVYTFASRLEKALVKTYGVIGNTAGFGPVILGSSPSRSTKKDLHESGGPFAV